MTPSVSVPSQSRNRILTGPATGPWISALTSGSGMGASPPVSRSSSRTTSPAGGGAFAGVTGARAPGRRTRSRMGLLPRRLVDAQRLVQERLGLGQRQLGRAIRERLGGIRVGLEEQAVYPARDRRAHEPRREPPPAAGLLAPRPLKTVGRV